MEQSRADSIATVLETRILDGTYPAETRLDEAQLAAEFDVSRTPVREALLRLTQSGLAEQMPRRGVFVRQPGPIELIEFFEIMSELEAMAARFAALRATEQGLEDIKAANARCRAAVEDVNVYYEENEVFHALIYSQCGNSMLEAECLRLQRRLRPYRRMQLRLRGRLIQSLAEHVGIVQAIEAGDADAAARRVRDHISVQGEKFRVIMSRFKEEVA